MNNLNFLFSIPTLIVFGCNSIEELGKRVKEIGGSKAILVTDKGIVNSGILEEIKTILSKDDIEFVIFDEVEPNPFDTTIERGTNVAIKESCDVVIGIGGGSSMDSAKAIAMRVTNRDGSLLDYVGINKVKNIPLPIIAVPTTSGTASELTIFSVLTNSRDMTKISIGSDLLTPKIAICDPILTVSMPPNVTATTGMDALTHAVESYVTTVSTPVTKALALESIRLISINLRRAVSRGEDLQARSNMLLASLLAGMAFRHTRLGIAHALAMPLGSWDIRLPHGLANALVLPYVMEFNLPGNLEGYAEIAIAMGESPGSTIRETALKSVKAVKELIKDIGLPRNLKSVGVKKEDFDRIAEEAMKSGNLAVNPRVCRKEDLISILEASYEGE
ncbi:MAG: iron-containing alcohol dehydrogenase [bacterium]|nr:iron-containing alcohol dehydrogenase [bacterium]